MGGRNSDLQHPWGLFMGRLYARRSSFAASVAHFTGDNAGPTLPATRAWMSNIDTARNTRRVLADTGHTVDFIEVPEGHNPTTWRNHLSDVLVSLYGDRIDR
jgi:enterochelin esterase-like enzyme